MNLVADESYWKSLEQLVAKSRVVIDRPKGTHHPRFPEMVYPFDYGFLEDTTGNDGAEVDIWRGSIAGGAITGVTCTVDLMKKDAEVKILLGCTPEEIAVIHEFYNTGAYMNGLTIIR
jgi:inorganic pyrophosphatase